MLLTCKHVYVYSGDRCGVIVRGISHQCQCFYSWIAFACLYQVLRSLNISGLPIMRNLEQVCGAYDVYLSVVS